MFEVQNILVYITVLVAVGFLVKKFLLPKPIFSGQKKKPTNVCNDNNCGCH